MKSKINPNEKNVQSELNQLVHYLAQQSAVLQIYHYASLSRTEKLKGIFSAKHKIFKRVYYLFIITEGTTNLNLQLLVEEQDFPFMVMVSQQRYTELQKPQLASNGFLARVFNTAKLLYTVADFEAPQVFRLPNPKKSLARAIVHWRNRTTMATGFVQAAEQAIEQGHERVALFLLHQATEQLCAGMLYVFMEHQLPEKRLHRLIYRCACFSTQPLQHLLGCSENEALIQYLEKSIQMDSINEPFDLGERSVYRFLELIESFMVLARTLCETKFKAREKELRSKEEIRVVS
jgi:HEPN domain-containing protein